MPEDRRAALRERCDALYALLKKQAVANKTADEIPLNVKMLFEGDPRPLAEQLDEIYGAIKALDFKSYAIQN